MSGGLEIFYPWPALLHLKKISVYCIGIFVMALRFRPRPNNRHTHDSFFYPWPALLHLKIISIHCIGIFVMALRFRPRCDNRHTHDSIHYIHPCVQEI